MQTCVGVWSLISAWLAWPGQVASQLPDRWVGRSVQEVVITGVTAGLTPAQTAPEVVGIPLGSVVSRALLRDAVLRLSTSGSWRDAQLSLQPAGRGVRVVAHLVPRTVLVRVDIVGNEAIDDDTISRALGLAAGTELFPERLPSQVQEAEALYRDRGYEHVEASAIVRDTDDPTRKLLVVRFHEGVPTRIAAIRFSGEAPPRQSRVRASLGVGPGDILDRKNMVSRLREAAHEARRRGWLETRLSPPIYDKREQVDGQGADIVITIPSHFGPRYATDIVGNGPVPRADILDALELGSELLSPASLESMRLRCTDLFRRYGFHRAEAEVTLAARELTPIMARAVAEDRGRGQRSSIATRRLVVTIRPGQPLHVESLAFPGSEHFEPGFLRNQVFSYLQEELPGSSFLHPVDTEVVDALGFGSDRTRGREVETPLRADPETIFYAPTYQRAIDHIRELYQAEGFLAASVGAPRLRHLKRNRVAVQVPVEEGPQTLLQRVDIRGNRVLSVHEIMATTSLRRGQPFSPLALEEAKDAIVKLYQDHGYFYARVEQRDQFSADRSRAAVTFTVVESVQVRIANVEVKGNNLTETSLILDRLSFDSGDLYRPAAIRESQELLLSLGIFSGVAIAPKDAELPATDKTVVVTVSERKAQYVDLGGGFSTGQGFRGHFEYGFRNAFGLGHEFIFRMDAAFQVLFLGDSLLQERFQALSDADRLERTVTGEWRIPHFFDRHLRASVNAAINRDNERDFGIERVSVGARLGWTPLRSLGGTRVNASLGAALEQTTVDLFVAESLDEFLRTNTDPRLERLLRVPEGSTTIVGTEASASLDLRDSPFTPTEGFFAGTTLEYVVSLTARDAGDGDDFFSNFLKWSFTTSAYLPLGGDVVLAGQARYGRVFHLTDDSKTYPNRAFYLGGVDTIRGYLLDALIPQDVADQVVNDPTLGPTDVARAGDTFLLLRGELRFPLVGAFRGGAFLDLGNLWADPTLMLDTFSLRPTAGIGLRLQTPVGPLAFDYGFILIRRRELSEPVGTFHFSIGLF